MDSSSRPASCSCQQLGAGTLQIGYTMVTMVYPIHRIPPKWIQNGDNNRDTDDWPLDLGVPWGTLFWDKPPWCIPSPPELHRSCKCKWQLLTRQNSWTVCRNLLICSWSFHIFIQPITDYQHTKLIQTALHAFAPVHLSLQLSCQDQLEEHHSLETMTEADHRPARCS